jgi:glycosyltransferase involved in cell wall biosynthesis
LINNYNYQQFLGEAIDSALSQTYEPIEVIVVDDGSTDNSREIIASYGSRIIPVLKENGGQASAYNAGFAASSGEILCLLDSDDVFLPEKVRRLVDIFQQYPECGWCFDAVREFETDTGVRYQPSAGWIGGKWDAREATISGKPPYVATASSGLSFRRHVLERIFPMPEMMRIKTGSSSDAYIKWISLALAEGWMASEELTLQRIHRHNAYTRRKVGKQRLGGQIEFLTGICLYQQFPPLKRLATKVFSRGLGMLWATGGLDHEDRQNSRSFLQALATTTRCEVLVRALYWNARRRLSV